MSFGPLRSLVLSVNQAVHGVAATVTRPAPDGTPIETTVLWPSVAPVEDSQPYGTDFSRKGPRRVMAIPKVDVATLPIGTLIVAPEQIDGTNKNWRVDALDRSEADTWRAIVMLAP